MNKIKIQTLHFISGIFLFSCSQQQEQKRPNTFAPNVVEAKGYLVPKDSLTEAKVIPADKRAVVRAGNPKVVTTNTNIVLAGKSKNVLAGKPRICTPGQDTFLLPKTVPAIDNPFVAGIPEVVNVKDPYIKDQNPKNFSSYSKLQGLKHDVIRCMMEDKSGNLWFGTYGGGVSKYDGKHFTHFTNKEGLSDNSVLAMLEDKSGNIWFGTNEGVSKYDGQSFTHFTEKEGLSNNTARSILEDKNGNLWFGSYGGGLSKYDGKSFTHFTEKEGLSNNTVFCMLQDKSGNLWFGTEFGVSKYDGKSFMHFTEKEGLNNNIVFSILEDKSGNLWFGTYNGVSKYDGNRVEEIEAALQRGEIISARTQQDLKKENGKFAKSFTYFTMNEGLSNNTVRSILEDKNGNIWFGTYGGGLSRYDGNSLETVERGDQISLDDQEGHTRENRKPVASFMHFTEEEGLISNIVLSILEDKSGNLWFGTDGGASRLDGKIFTHFTVKEGLTNNTNWSVLEDKKGNLWLGTDGGGVSKYDGRTFTHFTEKEGLSHNTVRSILEDRSGNIWFGTYLGGVSKYDGNRVEEIEAALQRGEVIPEQALQGLKKENGKFVKSFTHFTENEGLSKNTVFSILEDKSGNLWFGTSGGGVSKYDGNSFTHYTSKEGLSDNSVLSMLEDKNGTLWFGTKGGLSKYDGKFFTHFTEKEGLTNNSVWSILEDKNGILWFGTSGGGVSKYDGKSFTYFTEKEGLSNNNVLSMLEDKNGNLLLGTRFGLSILTQKNKRDLIFFSDGGKYAQEVEGKVFFKNYTYEDGFTGIGVNGGKTICEDKNGTIWIATNNRLTAYHPEGDFSDTIAPNIQLTSIELFNENIAWVSLQKEKIQNQNSKENNIALDTSFTLGNGVNVGDFEFSALTKWYSLPENLSLAYDNNYLTFNFIGITLKQSKKVKYKYKLDGIDENWSSIANKTEAHYGNLPDGTYSFKVKAMNSEGYWSEELNYTFTIRPPWWKTWWFRTIVILFGVASVWYYIKWREKKLIAEKEILEQTVKERTAEVVEQKHIIEEKHREITDSINYAERIQRSFLATTSLLDENLKDYFVFFQPKDVVSGDFYWAAKLSNGNFALATADSTGHGVPGAIMSILNISCLEKSVEEEKLTEPNEILGHTRSKIIERLKKDGSADGGKDGMDCSLISFDFANNKLTYAAANNPIWIVREKQLLEFASDKMPVGKHDKDTTPFTQHVVNLQKGDMVYALTDGMPDQFGGAKGKKFMYKQLKELLISIYHLPMQEQNETLKSSLNTWKGNLEQVDDICLIGIRV
jgi:ligand-binding sensor domain-containing protein/serine phosphatase RsbU (regulator of sigma subunit)